VPAKQPDAVRAAVLPEVLVAAAAQAAVVVAVVVPAARVVVAASRAVRKAGPEAVKAREAQPKARLPIARMLPTQEITPKRLLHLRLPKK
jgi:hypothetical protein